MGRGMTAEITRVRGRFGDLPVPLVQASNDFTEKLFDLVDAAVEAGLPLEMVLGDMQVVNAAILKGLFDMGAR